MALAPWDLGGYHHLLVPLDKPSHQDFGHDHLGGDEAEIAQKPHVQEFDRVSQPVGRERVQNLPLPPNSNQSLLRVCGCSGATTLPLPGVRQETDVANCSAYILLQLDGV